ncbi:right-handed parallel beta-helix repeat-containing protein, partial [bacterium]|nr:right-handed parallel beta-helix repeat-containing protein [bacterium]
MSSVRTVVLSISCLILVCGTAFCTDYYVDVNNGSNASSGLSPDDAWRTITHALNAVEGIEAEPETIHIAAGTYSTSTNGETFPLKMKSWVSLSGEARETTKLDAEKMAYHVIYCDEVDNLTISGFTISGGLADGDYTQPEGKGAGVYCESSSPTIQNNIISNNSTTWFGGGIYSDEESSPHIRNNVIEDNEAGTHGGGICALGDSTVITDNYVAHNVTEGGHSGGIHVQGDSPLLANNLIVGNRASWGFGGGILCANGSALITNNTIYGNNAGCTDGYFGGIYCSGGASPTIENCIVWGNEGADIAQEYTCRVLATYCCLGRASDAVRGEGCIGENPMFVPGPLGDYYLDPNSACIDAGSISAVELGLSGRTTQDDGAPDIGAVDMGFHYPIPTGERPKAYIDSISPNPATQGVDTIQLAGHGTDPDGTVQAHEWSSDLEGILSTSHHFNYPASRLELGTHIISYRVQDDSGLWSKAAIEELVVEAQFPIPVAYIDSMLPNPAVQGRDTVEFRGYGSDKDGAIEAYEWSSDLDGVLSVEKDFQRLATHLSLGTHTISFRVRDDDYQWSESAIKRLYIRSRERVEVFVNGETGDDSGDGSQAAPFRTITHALAAVLAFEESPAAILVAPGTYSASTNGETFPLTMRSFVSMSGDGAGTTILDGERSANHIIYCVNVGNLIVEGFTITGGAAYGESQANQFGGALFCASSSVRIQSNTITDNYSAVGGAGIYCHCSSPVIIGNTISYNTSSDYGGGICCMQSSPTILNNIITGNEAHCFGGGVYCEGGSSPLIEQNTISGNTALSFGGGIYCERSSPTISNNVINANVVPPQATDINGGGGICCKDCSPMIAGNMITRNYAYLFGGGILCDESSPVISCNTISSNDTESLGGAIYCENGSSAMIMGNSIMRNSTWRNGGGIYCDQSSPKILDNEIANNSVDDDGAGMYLSQSPATISGNTISENRAGKRGGGIFCAHSSPIIFDNLMNANVVYSGQYGLDGGGIYVNSQSSPVITFCTLLDNLVPESRFGGGVYCEKETAPTITNCILWGNGDDLYNGTATFCCIEDDDPGEGNISADPMFATGSSGDYYLDPDSPCVDAGSQSAQAAGLSDRTTQSDSTPDIGIVDIGYHYPTLFMMPEVWVSTPSDTYSHGEALEVMFEAINPNTFSYPVDLFVAVITTEGVLWTIDSNWVWSTSLKPWFASLELPANFAFGRTTLMTIDLPSTAPPISDPGTYYV